MICLKRYRKGLTWAIALLGVNHEVSFARVKAVPTARQNVAQKAIIDKEDKKDKKALQKEVEEENALNRVLLEKKLAGVMAQIEQLRLERERKRLSKELEDAAVREEHEKNMRTLQMEKEKLMLEMEVAQAKFAKQMTQHRKEIAELEIKTQLERGHIQLLQEQKTRLQTEIDTLSTQAEREKHIAKKPIYLKEPLRKDNVLVLSDRCITLTGYISPWKANYIADQIQFFNNKNSTYPIFIVIDVSPGGMVWGLFHILQAMERSKAPVHVVVKEFAASATAFITTFAAKSYIYPNAEILHHQPHARGFICNSTRGAKEHYKEMQKLWKRLGGRLAQKMGISLKALDKKLYEKDMHGDWMEYGDKAKKLKWVDHVIYGIEDSAMSKLPNAADYTLENFMKRYHDFGSNVTGAQLSDEMARYYALAPHDFDYSYRPMQGQQKQAQVVAK